MGAPVMTLNMWVHLMTGWWYTYPSETYEFVSWDYELPNWMEHHKNHVPNHQPVEYLSRWLPKKHIDEFLTAKFSKSPDLAIAPDERVKRLIFEPFPVIGGLWHCFSHMIKLYYIYNTLWIQTLSQKELNPLNHTPVTLPRKVRLDGWIHRNIYIYIWGKL